MKVRLGVLTGSPEGDDTSGVYFSLDGTREGVVGIRGIYYCLKGGEVGKDAKVIQIYPGAGKVRVTGVSLRMDAAVADVLRRFGLATRDFSMGGGYMKLTIGKRVWHRNEHKSDIRWSAASNELFFLNNTGPFADSLLRGDYVQLEVGMAAWQDTYEPAAGKRLESLTRVGSFAPVTTCDVYVGANWSGGFACAAGVMNSDGEWFMKAQAYTASKKKKKKKSSRNVGQESTKRAVSGGPFSVHLMGDAGYSKVTVTYPAGMQGVTAQILDIYVQQ